MIGNYSAPQTYSKNQDAPYENRYKNEIPDITPKASIRYNSSNLESSVIPYSPIIKYQKQSASIAQAQIPYRQAA